MQTASRSHSKRTRFSAHLIGATVGISDDERSCRKRALADSLPFENPRARTGLNKPSECLSELPPVRPLWLRRLFVAFAFDQRIGHGHDIDACTANASPACNETPHD